ncbi:hypothetical protein J7E62_24845 [Variovorax paradoxus]|nr:hypothetical protein [Variovorax paradoxus]
MRAVRLLCLLLALALCLPAHADAVWEAVSARTLDGLRGGFDVGGGLLVSFGITRAVYVNGNLVTQTTLDFGRLSALTPAQAAQLNQQMAALNLVQSGPGNSVDPDVLSTGAGTIIQNTLNNQHIVNQTVINARSNAMGMVKSLNIQNTLNDALTRSAAPR